MTTNKDRIEKLELDFDNLKQTLCDEIQKLCGTSKSQFHELKEMIAQSLDKGESSTKRDFKGKDQVPNPEDNSWEIKSNGWEHQPHGLGPTKMDFPRYAGDDPTVWLNRVVQYFAYPHILDDQKVPLAAFHLESEANQWWQWLQKVYREDQLPITWDTFEKELLIRFGPTEFEDYNEALSKIHQKGTLREYQQEFECQTNRLVGWTQKALVGTFLGGLKLEIMNGVRMFKPRTLRDAIELARIRDDILSHRREAREVGWSEIYTPIQTTAKTTIFCWNTNNHDQCTSYKNLLIRDRKKIILGRNPEEKGSRIMLRVQWEIYPGSSMSKTKSFLDRILHARGSVRGSGSPSGRIQGESHTVWRGRATHFPPCPCWLWWAQNHAGHMHHWDKAIGDTDQ
jgi:hypothetical protein